MGKLVLFWMVYPLDENIDYDQWSGFCEEMAGVVVGVWLVMTALIIGGYWWTARQEKILVPSDVFRPYTPMRWLWWAVAAGVMVSLFYAYQYQTRFTDTTVSFMADAPWVGLWTTLWTFLLAYLLMWLPGITPAKYRYRPRWLRYRKRGAWHPGEE